MLAFVAQQNCADDEPSVAVQLPVLTEHPPPAELRQ
jgi:hypothetical protein